MCIYTWHQMVVGVYDYCTKTAYSCGVIWWNDIHWKFSWLLVGKRASHTAKHWLWLALALKIFSCLQKARMNTVNGIAGSHGTAKKKPWVQWRLDHGIRAWCLFFLSVWIFLINWQYCSFSPSLSFSLSLSSFHLSFQPSPSFPPSLLSTCTLYSLAPLPLPTSSLNNITIIQLS